MSRIGVDRHRFFRVFLPALLSVVLVVGGGLRVRAEPKLVIPQGDEIELRESTEGEIREGSFTIVNRGDSPLEVYNFIVTCACVEILNRDIGELSPGESRTVEFTFDTTGYGGEKTRKEVMIFSNASQDPERFSVSIVVKEREDYHLLPGEYVESLSILVDIRSPDDFHRGHIAGAVNVPREALKTYLRELPPDVHVVIYSQTGELANSTVLDLAADFNGELKSLVGGIEQWATLHEKYVIEGKY
ncbi:MAG: rhodanese-like domain-containing protein [Candidatus Acetothermia bacterium]